MAIKFEVNKWYQFKNKQAQENFIKDHTDNGIYARRLGMHPFKILDVDHLGRPTKNCDIYWHSWICNTW